MSSQVEFIKLNSGTDQSVVLIPLVGIGAMMPLTETNRGNRTRIMFKEDSCPISYVHGSKFTIYDIEVNESTDEIDQLLKAL